MPKDIIVHTSLNSRSRPAESLSILVLQTDREIPLHTFRNADDMLTIPNHEEGCNDPNNCKCPMFYNNNSIAYQQVKAMFNQGGTLASSLIRRVKVAGIDGGALPAAGADAEELGKARKALIDAIEEFRAEVDDDWYVLITDRTDANSITALSELAYKSEPTLAQLNTGEPDNRKLYFCQAPKAEVFVNATSSELALDPKFGRSAGMVAADSERPGGEQTAAAYIGNVGPFYPESVTWKFKRPDGIELPDLSRTQREELECNNWNYLASEYGNEYMKNGTMFDGEFIDNVLGADWITQDMRNRLYQVFMQNPNIDYTDEGFALVSAAVVETLNQAVVHKIIARDPESGAGVFTVVTPTRDEATDDQARNRELPPIYWDAQFAGAVHSAKTNGVLHATLPN